MDLESIKSSAKVEYGRLFLRFKSSANMSDAVMAVRDRVGLIGSWPQGAKSPVIQERSSFELVASVLIGADANWFELEPWARRAESSLLNMGVDQVEVIGLPDTELMAELSLDYLYRYPNAIGSIGDWLGGQNVGSASLGDYYQTDMRYQIGLQSQYFHPLELQQLPIRQFEKGWQVMPDGMTVQLRQKLGQAQVWHQGQPAVAIMAMRAEGGDTFKIADAVESWYRAVQDSYPAVLEVKLFNLLWKYIYERIELMLGNGAMGLVLIALTLWFFLRARIVRWVLLGIPIAFSLSLFLLYCLGGTINQIALFGFIMALGVVVDDTIVVCEVVIQAYESGKRPWAAVMDGLRFMGLPIVISSLTTVAAFLPLLALSGPMGDILTAIPLVVVVVILASLVECFLILPRHLYLEFKDLGGKQLEVSKSGFAWIKSGFMCEKNISYLR